MKKQNIFAIKRDIAFCVMSGNGYISGYKIIDIGFGLDCGDTTMLLVDVRSVDPYIFEFFRTEGTNKFTVNKMRSHPSTETLSGRYGPYQQTYYVEEDRRLGGFQHDDVWQFDHIIKRLDLSGYLDDQVKELVGWKGWY